MTKVLCIITARGNSISIPRKNVKPFAGKPLIAWSIETAIKSGIVDRTVVTTDSEEIAEVSKRFGADVPFMRPSELALDTTPTLPVLQHAVKWLRDNENYYPDYVLLLEPTSPARQAFHIREAIGIAESTKCDSVIALGAVPGHHNFHWQIDLQGDRAALIDGTPWPKVIRRRQDLPPTYFRNGAFYLFRPDLLLAEEPSLYGSDVRGYVIDEKYSVDIDTHEDWADAEAKFIELLDAVVD